MWESFIPQATAVVEALEEPEPRNAIENKRGTM